MLSNLGRNCYRYRLAYARAFAPRANKPDEQHPMNYETIDEIYEGNEKIRERLKALIASLSPEQLSASPADGEWNVTQIVEHISMVDEGAMRICAKLLAKAGEATSDGRAIIRDEFLQRAREGRAAKLQAPDIVRPTGEKSIDESFAKLEQTREQLEQMRDAFKTVDGTGPKFPHPYFGDMSAQEWLALKGGHELRHIKQIERIVAKGDKH